MSYLKEKLGFFTLILSSTKWSNKPSHATVHEPLIKGELTTNAQIFDPVKFVKF